MKKFIISLLIFFVSTFFSTNVNAYYFKQSDDTEPYAFVNFDLKNITKDSFMMSNMDSNYFDYLVTIDNYLRSNNYRFTIYLGGLSSDKKYRTFYISVYPNTWFPSKGWEYIKFHYGYSNTYSNSFIPGVSKNLSTFLIGTTNSSDFWKTSSGYYVSNVSQLNEIITKINNNENPFSNISFCSSNCGSTPTSSDSKDGDLRLRDGSYSPILFSSSEDVYLFDYNNTGFGLRYLYSNGDIQYIYRGDVIPQLYDIFKYSFKASGSINDLGNYHVRYFMRKEVIQSNNSFDFKIVGTSIGDNFSFSEPVVKLYKQVLNKFVEVDDSSITYTYSYKKMSDNQFIITGSIVFPSGVSPVGDYTLDLLFSNISNIKFDFYDADEPMTVFGIQPEYLFNYSYYVFPDGYDTAFISSADNVDFDFYINQNYASLVNFNFLFPSVYNYESKSYSSLVPYNVSDNRTLQGYKTSINHELKQILVLKLTKDSNATNQPGFYLPPGLTVKFVYFENVAGVISSHIYGGTNADDNYFYKTPDGNVSKDDFLGSNDDTLFINKPGDPNFTPDEEGVKSALGFINNYLNNATDTINYVKKIIQTFFDDMPSWLNSFFVIAWIFLHLKVTIVLGGWK